MGLEPHDFELTEAEIEKDKRDEIILAEKQKQFIALGEDFFKHQQERQQKYKLKLEEIFKEDLKEDENLTIFELSEKRKLRRKQQEEAQQERDGFLDNYPVLDEIIPNYDPKIQEMQEQQYTQDDLDKIKTWHSDEQLESFYYLFRNDAKAVNEHLFKNNSSLNTDPFINLIDSYSSIKQKLGFETGMDLKQQYLEHKRNLRNDPYNKDKTLTLKKDPQLIRKLISLTSQIMYDKPTNMDEHLCENSQLTELRKRYGFLDYRDTPEKWLDENLKAYISKIFQQRKQFEAKLSRHELETFDDQIGSLLDSQTIKTKLLQQLELEKLLLREVIQKTEVVNQQNEQQLNTTEFSPDQEQNHERLLQIRAVELAIENCKNQSEQEKIDMKNLLVKLKEKLKENKPFLKQTIVQQGEYDYQENMINNSPNIDFELFNVQTYKLFQDKIDQGKLEQIDEGFKGRIKEMNEKIKIFGL